MVFVWSVDELQASEGQTRMSCDPVGCVALCFTSSREFRGAVELYGLKELRPDVGFVEAEQDPGYVRDLCLLRGVVRCLEVFMFKCWRCPCGDINGAGLWKRRRTSC